MKLHFFSVPMHGPAPAALDALLASARVATIDRHFVADGPNSQWAICVTTLDGPASPATESSSRPRVDYREKLPPEQFERFARLRALRKQMAQAEGVPPYAIFNDEQLAQIAMDPAMALSTLAGLPGVGPNRVEKYGAAFLAAAGAS
jgi:superfamily II DNA helicase RecQ